MLPLPYPYIVPGDRFDEIYYWDSHFIMLGLQQSGRQDLLRDELNNFATLIDRYGHIPNGNRTYYLSRSQPPFFAQMVRLAADHEGDQAYLRYLPELLKEYAYWMDGRDRIAPGDAYRHLVRLPDGTLLNRYWDDRAAPRDESFKEDVVAAQQTPQRNPEDLWRNLRAAGETGWGFSSRWFADGRTLATVEVTSLIPVDLNCLLVDLERTLAKAYRVQGDATHAENFEQRAAVRADAIRRLLWDPQLSAFGDYNFVAQRLTHRLSAATVYPLYTGIATKAQAMAVAVTLRARMLRPGGLATTTVQTGQQWDEPNGWAPLQYLAVTGLRRYGGRDGRRQPDRHTMDTDERRVLPAHGKAGRKIRRRYAGRRDVRWRRRVPIAGWFRLDERRIAHADGHVPDRGREIHAACRCAFRSARRIRGSSVCICCAEDHTPFARDAAGLVTATERPGTRWLRKSVVRVQFPLVFSASLRSLAGAGYSQLVGSTAHVLQKTTDGSESGPKGDRHSGTDAQRYAWRLSRCRPGL